MPFVGRAVAATLCRALCSVTSQYLSPHPVASNTSHQTTQRYLQRTYLMKDVSTIYKEYLQLIVRRQTKNEQKLEETFIQRYTNV